MKERKGRRKELRGEEGKRGALEAVGPDRGKKEKVVEDGKSPSREKNEAALRNILSWQFGESTSKTAEGERGDRAFSGTAGERVSFRRGRERETVGGARAEPPRDAVGWRERRGIERECGCVGEAPGNWPILSRDREEEEEEEGREKEGRGKREKRGGGPTTASEGGKEREEGFTSSNCSSLLWPEARNLLGCVLECGL